MHIIMARMCSRLVPAIAFAGLAWGGAMAATNVVAHDAAAGIAAADTAQPDPTAAALLPARIRKAGVLVVGAELQQTPADFSRLTARHRSGGGGPRACTRHAARRENPVSTDAVRLLDREPQGGPRGHDHVGDERHKTPVSRRSTFSTTSMPGSDAGEKGNPDKITTPDDLCGKAVSVQSGTTQEAFAKSQSQKCTASGKPAVNIVVSSSGAGAGTIAAYGTVRGRAGRHAVRRVPVADGGQRAVF